MRILANENFPFDAVSALRDHGHDVAWIRTDSPGSSDPEVLDRAQREERIRIPNLSSIPWPVSKVHPFHILQKFELPQRNIL